MIQAEELNGFGNQARGESFFFYLFFLLILCRATSESRIATLGSESVGTPGGSGGVETSGRSWPVPIRSN